MEKFNLKSNFDGIEIPVLVSKPDDDTNILGIVQINHGMCEYKERYLHFLKVLSKNGYIAVIHDHRGHGLHITDSKKLGYFGENGEEGIVLDSMQVGDYFKAKYKGLPFYLFGHSMGSMVVRASVKRNDKNINGLIVCGTPEYNKLAEPAGHFVNGLCKIGFAEKENITLAKLIFSKYQRPFKSENNQHSWVCGNEEVIKKYEKDKHCNFIFKNNGFASLLLLTGDICSSKGWTVENPDLPILFLSGEQDMCNGGVKTFKKSVEHMRNIGYKNVSCKLYKNMRHEILNEKDNKQVFSDILKWIKHN